MKCGALSKATRWEVPDRPPTKLIRLVFERLNRNSMKDSTGCEVIFHLPVEFELSGDSDGSWRCDVPFLDIHQRGMSREVAMAVAADVIRAETDTLLHTMSHTLNREQLVRKGLLLGAVDVLKSKIAKSIGEFTWVSGRVEKDDQGNAWFREAGTDGETFSLDPSVPAPSDRLIRMAKMRMDDIGDPIGPVLELEEPVNTDPAATWAEWERLMSRDAE